MIHSSIWYYEFTHWNEFNKTMTMYLLIEKQNNLLKLVFDFLKKKYSIKKWGDKKKWISKKGVEDHPSTSMIGLVSTVFKKIFYPPLNGT